MPGGVRRPPPESPARRARYPASHRTTSRSSSPLPRPPPQGELIRHGVEGRELRVTHHGLDARPERVRRDRATRREPGEHLAPRHRRSNPSTIARACARARPSFAGSPAPAEAKCGRPPPLPPDTATMALAMSPAFTPCCTRSSVTATCTPACSPFVNRTVIARLWLERNTSITRPI